MTRIARWTVAIACIVASLVFPGGSHAQSWKAGVAREKITPAQFMWMAGYASRNKPADNILADLWTKTVVLQDPRGKQVALIAVDLIGIDRTLSQELRDTLERRFALRRGQIAICFSHTHSGPVVGKCLEPLHYRQLDEAQRLLIDQYAAWLVEHVEKCVAAAMKDLRPCHLTWGSGEASFAVNRRNNPANQVTALREANALKGPFDHDVPVLAIRADDGTLRAVIFGYACHATVLDDYGWSGDYPGFATAELETRYDGTTALFWAGCGADQNPLPRRTHQLARQYGHQLADAVAEVVESKMQPITGQLEVTYQEIPLALDTLPNEVDLQDATASENKYIRARAEMLLEQIASDGSLAQTYPYPIGTWKIGNTVEFVFLGGEVVVDFALRLKNELNGKQTWVAGYTNDVMAYIPSERVLKEGGYEGNGAMVYYGLPAAWAPGVEQAIIGAVKQGLTKQENLPVIR